MHSPSRYLVSILFTALITAVLVAGVIYLTPLRHVNVVEPTIQEITPTDFYEKFSANPDEFIFIDVRPEQFYNALHAEGSENIMLHRLYFERHNLPKRGKTIVLICSGEGSPSSGVAYSYLEHFGFFNLLRIKGGIEAWEAADLPTVS